MGLTIPDMSNCDRKCKCCSGINKGRVYPCASPCDDANEEFDEELCQCSNSSCGTWFMDYIFYTPDSGTFCEFDPPPGWEPPPDYDGTPSNRSKGVSFSYNCTPIEWVHVASNRCTGFNCSESEFGFFVALSDSEFLSLTGADYVVGNYSFGCGEQDVLYLKLQNDIDPSYGAFSGAILLYFIQGSAVNFTANSLRSKPVSYYNSCDPNTVYEAAQIPTLILHPIDQ